MPTVKKVPRHEIGHFMNVTPTAQAPSYKRINLGVSGLTIDYNPETSDSHYIAEKTGTSDITSYKPSASVDMECYFGDEVYEAIMDYLGERHHMIPAEGHEEALFLSMQNRRISVRAVENLVKKKQGPKTPKQTRNGFNCRPAAKTHDLTRLKKLGGFI